MLSFRMILFCGIGGICLWGLFNLLDNLKQPQLLRSAKAIIVKGCEPAESEEALQLCPQLYCQKALLDSTTLARRTRFTVTADKKDSAAKPSTHLIAGTLTGSDGVPGFACLLEQHKVIAKRRLDAAELDALTKQNGGWRL
jgi:hypothetical protein